MQCRINLSRAWGKTILRAGGKTILRAGHKIYEFARGCEKVRFLRLDISEIYKTHIAVPPLVKCFSYSFV
jgi:hypothetical protein